jgi:hypothetical protein
MRGGAALKLLRLRHHLNFSLSWYLNVSLTSSSKHTLFVFWNTLDTNKNVKKKAAKPQSIWIYKTNEEE